MAFNFKMPYEKKVLPQRELGIYIHIPFCRSKCQYCDFYSLATKEDNLFDGYLEKLRMPPPPQGLGLGLPLCQAIARGHGGRLLLQSGPEGTTVTVSLPDRRCTKTVLREPPFAYGGGFHPVLLGLADALPYTAFTRKNLD